jgi:hypothetical protein
MKKTLFSLFAFVALLSVVPAAQAQHRHRHCVIRHHHRVCR